MNTVEIEVKIKVANFDTLRPLLDQVGAQLTDPRVYERNVRYENADQTLSSTGRVVRLRQDTRTRLTYKEPSDQVAQAVKVRTELEVTVSDFATMNAILGKLGYTSAWIYEKYRTTYHLYGAEVVLDELPYGNFIEIEGEPTAIEQAIVALSLTDQPRIPGGYSDLFAQLKTQIGLPFNDLTFDNFRGISIPPNAFSG